MRIIAGEARGRSLFTPQGRGTRPPLDQLRGSLFSILGDAVENAQVLDLFAGCGSFGLEALSRGASSATFVESQAEALAALERNILLLGYQPRTQVIRGNALHRPPAGPEFDIVFIDPPFALFDDEDERWALVARLEGLLDKSLRSGGTLLARTPPKHTLELRQTPADRRLFGASAVLFFHKP